LYYEVDTGRRRRAGGRGSAPDRISENDDGNYEFHRA